MTYHDNSTLRGKRQITMPEFIRKTLKAETGDKVTWTVDKDGNVKVALLRSEGQQIVKELSDWDFRSG